MIFNVGHIINSRYKIIDQVGVGGFGEVYKVVDLNSDNLIALKCLLPQLVEDTQGVVDMFKREALAAKKISSENVVSIFAVEETELRDKIINYFTMEYASDGDLDSFLKRQESYLSTEQLAHWMRQLLLGLRAVNVEIIHRDIKPKNILLFGDVLKISDFGLSKFIEQSTRTLTFKGFGTPLYMAPEVWENLSVTAQLDIYSMGMVFYLMASLKHPFAPIPSGEIPIEYLKKKHLYEIPKKPGEINKQLPDKLNLMIMKMIEKKPENRFKNVNEIITFLDMAVLSENKPKNNSITEIAGLLHTTEEKAKTHEIAVLQKRKKEIEEAENINNRFSFSCEDLLITYDHIIDEINVEASTITINKHTNKSKLRCEQTYSFHEKSIKILLERTDAITQVSNTIGWGYCYIDQDKDGFNLLLQNDVNGLYPKWRISITQDNALFTRSRSSGPHAMLDLPSLENALRGLHATHIYITRLKDFSLDDFVILVKKLASSEF